MSWKSSRKLRTTQSKMCVRERECVCVCLLTCVPHTPTDNTLMCVLPLWVVHNFCDFYRGCLWWLSWPKAWQNSRSVGLPCLCLCLALTHTHTHFCRRRPMAVSLAQENCAKNLAKNLADTCYKKKRHLWQPIQSLSFFVYKYKYKYI